MTNPLLYGMHSRIAGKALPLPIPLCLLSPSVAASPLLVLIASALLFLGAAAHAQTYSLETSFIVEGPTAGNDSAILTVTPATGTWTAVANNTWLHVSAGSASGKGSANVLFSFDANTGATRTGTFTIAGQTLTITQAGSTYVAFVAVTTLVSSGLEAPSGPAVDGSGNVYIADQGNFDSPLKEYSPVTQTVTTLVAGLSNTIGVAVDGFGNVYIADGGNNAIREYSPVTRTVTTLVSSGLSLPFGVAVDGSGNVYIADTYDNAIKEWTAATGQVTTLVSSGLNYPYGVAVDGSGNVYIADTYDNAIKEWTAATGQVTTLVSSGLDQPSGVAVDGSGNVYIADSSNYAVKEYTAATQTVSTLVSSGLSVPYGVAVDGSRNVYIADTGNNTIKELPRAFVDPTPKSETAAAGSDALPVVLPATENLLAPFAPTSDQSWLTIGKITGGVVNYSFSGNTTAAARTAIVTLFNQVEIAVTQAAPAAPSGLTYSSNPATYTNGTAITSNSPSSTGGPVATYSVSPALPTGLSLNTTTGVVTGTPTAITSTAGYTITATNSIGSTTASLTITVNDVAPSSLTYSTSPATYTIGTSIASDNPSSGGGPAVSYSVSPALPAGLSLNTGTGVITGTPTAITATATYTVTATNTGGSTTCALNVTVNDVAPSSLAYAINPATYTKGTAIASNTPSSSGGAVVSYSVSPSLPAGLTLNTGTGVISGTPMAVVATRSYTVTATNTGGSSTASLTITVKDVAPLALTYSTNPAIYTKGSAIVGNSPSSSGGAVVAYSVSPALPAGLVLNAATGIITGTPTAITSTGSYTVTATNTGGSTTVSLSVSVNDAAPAALTYSTNPATYTKGMTIASDSPNSTAGAVVSYSVSPALPAGLSLNTSTGVITGTPTAITAMAPYTVTATNTGGSTAGSLTITVNDVAPSALAYSTNPAFYTKGTAIASNSPSSTGGPVISYSVAPALPAGLILNSSSGVLSGTPTAIASVASYTVTATNSGGSTTAGLNITVKDVAPSALAYANNTATYTVGTAIIADPPSNSGGAVISYSVSPALPAGLILNSSSGILSGTPTAIASAANYTVTATNSGGSTTAGLNLTVKDVLPVATAQTLHAGTHMPLAVTLSAAEVITEPTLYTVLTQPLHGTLMGVLPKITYISDPTFTGTDSFTFQATDNGGVSAPGAVTIEVFPPVSKDGYYSGHYVGLISGADPAHSGKVLITSLGTGAFTGTISYGGVTYLLRGAFNSQGQYLTNIPRKGLLSLGVTLGFGLPDGPDVISGTVGGSTLVAGNAIYSAAAPTLLAGRYTVMIPPDPTQTDGSAAPQGYGVGTLVVAKTGSVTFVGTLADGTKFSRGTSLTRGGVWYLFLPLYATTGPLEGMLEGTIQFEETPEVSNLDGAVTWIRPALTKTPYPTTAFYATGFDLLTHLYGAAYSPKGSLVVTPDSPNNTFSAQGGSLAGGNISESATAGKAASTFKVTGASSLSLTVTTATGFITGSFKESTISLGRTISISLPVNAVVYQNGPAPSIVGWFTFTDQPKGGTNEGGAVTLTSP